LSHFNEFEFSQQIFEKYPNTQENTTIGSPVVPYKRADRQTDKSDEANSRFSQFCERVKITHIKSDKVMNWERCGGKK
jgi:hypothetical protein